MKGLYSLLMALSVSPIPVSSISIISSAVGGTRLLSDLGDIGHALLSLLLCTLTERFSPLAREAEVLEEYLMGGFAYKLPPELPCEKASVGSAADRYIELLEGLFACTCPCSRLELEFEDE